MLVNALSYLCVAAVVAVSVLGAGFSAARIAQRSYAQAFLPAAMAQARSAFISEVAAQIRTTGSAAGLAASATAPHCINSACTILVTAQMQPVQTASAPAAVCDPAQSDCAANTQTNAYVAEGRVAARITVNIALQGGTVLASRAQDVVARTTQTPPYAAIAGDAPADAGDDGGAAPATPNPCASAAAGSSSDTQVRVQYRNAVTSACTDASTWSDAAYAQPPGAHAGWRP